MKVKKLAASNGKELHVCAEIQEEKDSIETLDRSVIILFVTLLSCTRNNNCAHRSQKIKSNKYFIV